MDETEFQILDQGYQEDRQMLIDKKSAEISPAFEQRLQSANAAYAERIWVIRNSDYSQEDRQRIEQQELQIFEANKAEIEGEKEATINEGIAPDDQKLQDLVLGEGGRAEAERLMRENMEAAQEEQQMEAENETEVEAPETENAQDYFNANDFDYSQINENHETLSNDFNDIAPEGFEPTNPDHGIEP